MTPHIAQQLAAVEHAWALPEDHTLTDPERRTLEAFTGWGGLAKAFDPAPEGSWAEAADRLEAAMPPAAFAAARDQVDTSFFTPQVVADAVWGILTVAGFAGGRILEPGCGAGSFMGTAPAGVAVDWTGVEIDPTSARIARMLNPGAEIVEGALEETPLREGWFDAAIGNVPFSGVRVHDGDGRYAALHNYFAWRAVDAVRPGGYVVLVTSRYAMDARDGVPSAIREWDGAALVGAARLPSGAFSEAGTQAVTDIIVIRKNDDELHLPHYAGQPDFESVTDGYGYYGRRYREVDQRSEITGRTAAAPDGASVKVSRYWAAHPDHVAGLMLATGFDRAPLMVESADLAADIQSATSALAAHIPPMAERPRPADDLSDVILADADGRKEGSFHLIDGQMFRVVAGALAPARNSKELAALVGLRDLAVELLALEADTTLADVEIAGARAATREAYEAYVARFGHLNRGTLVEGKVDEETGLPALSWRRPAMGGFRRDPDSALVMALEVFDQDTGEAGCAPILTGRVNRAPRLATHAESAAEALAISLGESVMVDLHRIGELLGLDDEQATVDVLGDLVFHVDGRWQPASEALSGNVRRKLAQARATADQGDPDAARYAAALEKVMPADLGPTEISITLGSPFVSPADLTAFLKDVLGVRWASVAHTPSQAVWEVDGGGQDHSLGMQWGVPDMSPGKLVECALNNKLPEITDRIWDPERGDWRNLRNPQKSAAAAAKLELIRDRFSIWVWEDAERAARIVREYNDKLNSHVTRTFDGTGLTFPGMSDVFTPWDHQRSAVERLVSTERALIGHPVGAGKTLTMVAGARTLRQFGLANKPMIVVPNHLLDQIAREAQQAFPTGRFLIATKDDLARDARRLFAARCATGDWDAVIITHQAFGSIPVRPDVEESWIAEQKFRLRWALESESNGKSRGAKAIARAVRALDARIAKLRAGKNDPDAIWFDQLGVDYIMVDECFPWDTPVLTDRGELPIGQIVDEALDVKIASVNTSTGEIEFKPIHRWVRKEHNGDLVRIKHDGGEFTCTANHPIWVEGIGYVAAGHLREGDSLRLVSASLRAGEPTGEVLHERTPADRIKVSPVRNEAVRDLRADIHPTSTDVHDVQPRLCRGVPGGTAASTGASVRVLRRDHEGNEEAEVLQPAMQWAPGGEEPAPGGSRDGITRLPAMQEILPPAEHEDPVLLGQLPDIALGALEVPNGCLCSLHGRIRTDETTPEVLFPPLHDAAQVEGRRGCGASASNAGDGDARSHVGGTPRSRPAQDARAKSDARPGREGEDAVFASGENILVSWWQRDAYGTAVASRGEARVADGVLYSDATGLGSVRIAPELVRCRPGVPSGEAGNRGGREDSPAETVALPRRAEDLGIGSARVVRVEVLERGSAVRHGAGPADDPECDHAVYNLEVADNHNYFAAGVLVSNCHLFRRLDTQSQSRDNGMGSGSSKRATDLLVKIETLAERRPGMPVCAFFTGTPWSNTLAETWVWQRYLQPDALDAIGLLPFDAWVSAFIRYEHNIEVAPDGSGFRMYRRPVGVVNTPELKTLLGQVADIMDPAQLGLVRLAHEVVNVTVEATEGQRQFVRDLADRADAIRSGEARENEAGSVDNMLLICNDGRKVALDPQLAGVDERSSKITTAAQLIADAYHGGADRTFGGNATPGIFQLVFMDLGTPHPGDSQTYGRLRRQLVDRGIPAHQVRFVHEATTDKARAALFAACRDGEVAVLVASTAKAGMGTNIQTRLTHLWHIDAPWLPSDVIQREGRAVRPGNLAGHVTITRLVTEGTFDAYMWQALERKSRAFDALYATGSTAREIEDVSGATMSYGEVKALASGNPLLLDQAKARAEVKQLQVLRAMHLQGVNGARAKAGKMRSRAESALSVRETVLGAAGALVDAGDRDAALARLADAVRATWHSRESRRDYWGSRIAYRGMTISLDGRDRQAPAAHAQIVHGYRTVAEVQVRNGDIRRKPTTVAEHVLGEVDTILDTLDKRAARLEREAAGFTAEAASLEMAADGAIFDEQAELEDVLTRLAEIDAAIAEDAAQPVAA